MSQDIVRHELIGLNIEIMEAKNPSLAGLKGKIIDETKNTITIQHKNTTKKLIKNQIKMKIEIHNKTIMVNGEDLVGRPADRIKK